MMITRKPNLDLTLQGLFPNIDSDKDPKCQIIAELIQQLAKNIETSSMTQQTIQEKAESHYKDISQKNKLSRQEANHMILDLHRQGASYVTAQKYYSYRICATDTPCWLIEFQIRTKPS